MMSRRRASVGQDHALHCERMVWWRRRRDADLRQLPGRASRARVVDDMLTGPAEMASQSMSRVVKASVVLFVAAELAIFALIGVDSLPLLGGWALAALVVALCGWLVRGLTLR